MADRAIGELPVAPQLEDDSLLVVEQQSQARSIRGELVKQYAREGVEVYVEGARQSAAQAAASAQQAGGSAGEAAQSAQDAQTAQAAAETARDAIEDMTVEARTLPPGSEATVDKTAVGGSFRLDFGIPAGEQGAQGPAGAQGVQGPPGPQGIGGVAVEASGLYAFNVNDAGHLILSYTGDEAPDFSINSEGHLVLNIA